MVFRDRINKGLVLLFFILAAGVTGVVTAQVPVTKSQQKIIIKGNSYYVHAVDKGQTSFSIARAYSVTVETLHAENPDALYGLKEGQVLKIPVVEVTTTPDPVKDISKYVYHTVAAGETIYSLSRRYDVSQASILEANPLVDPADIPIGTELAIPRKDFKAPVVSIAPPQEEFTSYIVKPGETLATIARKFGVTARDLRRANGGAVFVREGEAIRIPGRHDTGLAAVTVAAVADTIPEVVVSDTVPEVVLPAGYTDISSLKGSIDIAVMLPLFLPENAARVEIDSTNPQRPRIREKPFTWIYPQSVAFLEMYEGILIAADELRSAGMDVRIHTFDTRADSAIVGGVINSGRIRNMDLIIGPIFSYNLEKVVAYAGQNNIPVVSPVPLRNNNVLSGNNLLYVVNPSQAVIEETLAASIGNHFDQNLVFIYSDTASTGNESAELRNMILRELSFRTEIGDVNFKQLLYRSWSSSPTDTLNRLAHTLNPLTDNVIILGTENEAAISETLMNLHTLHRKNSLILYGYPSVRNLEDNIELQYLFDLGINIFTPFYIDYDREVVLRFLDRFRTTFRAEPSEGSFAWIGYDITRYFASGLAYHGNRFLANPEVHNPELLHSRFDFRQDSNNDGFENWGLYHLRYSNQMKIEVIYNLLPAYRHKSRSWR